MGCGAWVIRCTHGAEMVRGCARSSASAALYRLPTFIRPLHTAQIAPASKVLSCWPVASPSFLAMATAGGPGGDAVADPRDVYDRMERIGKGNYASVYRARDRRSGVDYAVKLVNLEASESDISTFQREVLTLRQCKSEFVTSFRGAHLAGTRLWMVMEYLSTGSVADLLKANGALAPGAAAAVAYGAVRGLDYLHQRGHTHCDVKTANILLSPRGNVKLCDLGVANEGGVADDIGGLTQGTSKADGPTFKDWFPPTGDTTAAEGAGEATVPRGADFAGTPFYMAPEVLLRVDQAPPSDIWSLGIVMIEMVTGKCPRSHLHPMKVMYIIPREAPPKLDPSNGHNAKLCDAVSHCLQREPNMVSDRVDQPATSRRCYQYCQNQSLLRRDRVVPRLPQRASCAQLLLNKFIKGGKKTKELVKAIKVFEAWKADQEGDSSGSSSSDGWVLSCQRRRLPRLACSAQGVAIDR